MSITPAAFERDSLIAVRVAPSVLAADFSRLGGHSERPLHPRRDPGHRLPRRPRNQSRHPPGAIDTLGDAVDLLLCMTVNPGWGGQQFIPSMRPKIERLRARLPQRCTVEVDGGIDRNMAAACVELGANLLVAGSSICGQPSPGDAYAGLAAAVGA